MEEKYYVQQMASQAMRMIVPIPDGLVIPQKYLTANGTANGDFIAALRQYQAVLNAIYRDIAQNPEAFGMPRLEIEFGKSNPPYGSLGPMTANEAKSKKSFLRLPFLLMALAGVGVLTADGGLRVNVKEFKEYQMKTVKFRLTKPESILCRLSDYGFVIDGLPKDCSLKNREYFTVYYPDNRNLPTVIQSFRDLPHYEHMLRADYRYFLCEDYNKAVFDVEDIARACKDESAGAAVREISDFLIGKGFCCKVEFFGFFGKIRLSRTKSAKETVIILLERDHSAYFHLRLDHIAEYADKLTPTANVEKQLISGIDCSDCGYCNGKSVRFTYKNQAYRKCSVICAGFSFDSLCEEDIPSLLRILKDETALLTK